MICGSQDDFPAIRGDECCLQLFISITAAAENHTSAQSPRYVCGFASVLLKLIHCRLKGHFLFCLGEDNVKLSPHKKANVLLSFPQRNVRCKQCEDRKMVENLNHSVLGKNLKFFVNKQRKIFIFLYQSEH